MDDWFLPKIREEIASLQQKRAQHMQNSGDIDLSPNYVLIDAALWDSDMEILLHDETVTYRSLFRGGTGKKLWSVAPYLIDISSNEALIEMIKKKESVERRVVWLSSTSDIDQLRKHFRRFLRMKRENGSYIYFRFYDPHVANVAYPNLEQGQYSEFFETIDYIIADDRRVNKRHIFYLSAEKKVQIKHQPINYVDNYG